MSVARFRNFVVPDESCQKLPGLESEMRKGIFLADPRDVDAMLAAAHEIHGGRQIAPPGW